MQKSLLGHLPTPLHLLNKTSVWKRKVMADRGRVFAEMKLPILPYTLREFSLDAFYTGLKTCLDKLSVTCGESRERLWWKSIFASLPPWKPAEQTNRPKQYDIYHISITLNASVSILHCPRHTPVTRHTRCCKTIMALHCSSPSGGLIRLACA